MKFKERDWRRLLRDIAERKVVPVVGPELLPVEIDGEYTNLFRYITNQLIHRYDFDVADFREGHGLGDVVDAILKDSENERDDLYSDVREIIGARSWVTPEPLRKLAEIRQLRLYLTTTVDSLMEQALNEARFGGEARTRVLAYCRKSEVVDFADDYRPGKIPSIFQFFGKLNPVNDFAVIDEDILEFARRMQSPYRRPNNLFDMLRNKRVLLLGCNFAPWLTRFFLSAVKGEELFMGGARDLLADRLAAEQPNLVTFLERQKTNVYGDDGGAIAFVDELHRRWVEEFGDVEFDEDEPAESDSVTTTDQVETALPPLQPDAVFISFHSGDRETAREIARKFAESGIDTWFDEADLDAGDNYRLKIEANIEKCSYFFPLISAFSVSGERRFFQLEWHKAIDEAKFRPQGYPFLQPIILDDTPPEHAGIPREFRQHHCSWLKDLPKLIELTRERIRDRRRAERAA